MTIKCNQFRKSEALVLAIISGKCCDNSDRMFEEKESIEVLKTFGLIKQKCSVYLKNKPDKKIRK